MRKKGSQLEKKVPTRTNPSRTTEAVSFKDKVATKTPDYAQGNSSLEASDLFSLFTANIIKEEKVFTR